MKKIVSMREIEKSFPCKDCITFPMCKSRFVFKVVDIKLLKFTYLSRNCPLVRRWYYEKYIVNPLKLNSILRTHYETTTIIYTLVTNVLFL